VEIPVYITNKNRVTPMRRLVDWLLETPDVGKVTILDQGSTYPPLLEYYDEIKEKVEIKLLEPNPHLCWVFWALKMEEQQTGPYIVTDGDYVPADFCPPDIISKMHNLLETYFDRNFWKVGPGLRLDNLTESPWKEEVLKGEAPYWQHRLTPECFASAIDTSFAIYKQGFGDQAIGHAIRMDAPYLFEHTSWYTWPFDEEQRYYMAHDDYTRGHTAYLKKKGLV